MSRTFNRQAGLIISQSLGIDPNQIPEAKTKFEFSKEELAKCQAIAINKEIADNIDAFPNLKKALFVGFYFDTDTVNHVLKNLKDLEYLGVRNVKNLEGFNVSHNDKLKTLYIADNLKLINIQGLDKLDSIQEISFFNNPVYANNEKIVEKMKDVYRDNGTIYADIIFADKFRQEIDNYKEDDKRFSFIESVSIDREVYLTSPLVAKRILEEADKIVENFVKEGDNDKQKHACLTRWFQSFTHYNLSALLKEREDKEPNFQLHNTAGLFLSKDTCCEGLSKGMALLLAMSDITGYAISIYTDTGRINVDAVENRAERKANLGDHSIVKCILDGQVFDHDITLDINRYYKGASSVLLKTDEELLKDTYIPLNYRTSGMIGVEENEQYSLLNYSMKVLCDYFYKVKGQDKKELDFEMLLKDAEESTKDEGVNKYFEIMEESFGEDFSDDKKLYKGILDRVNFLICDYSPDIYELGLYSKQRIGVYFKSIEKIENLVEKYQRNSGEEDIWNKIEKDIKDSRNSEYDYGDTIDKQISFIKTYNEMSKNLDKESQDIIRREV